MTETAIFEKLLGRQREIIKAIFDKSETDALACLYEMVGVYYEKLRKKEKRSFRMQKRINVMEGQCSLRPFSHDLEALVQAGYLGELVWSDTITLENLLILQPCRDYFEREAEYKKVQQRVKNGAKSGRTEN